MNINIPQNEKGIVKFVQEEHEAVLKLHHDINADYLSRITSNITERRDFYKTLASLCGIILGFAPFLFERNNVHHFGLFFVGISLLLLNIVLIINYIRSGIDTEGGEYLNQLTEYNDTLNSQMEARRNFLLRGIYTLEAFKQHLQEMKNISEPILKKHEEYKKNSEAQKQKRRMDYAGEYFVYFFVMSILALMFSLFKLNLSFLGLIVLVFVPFVIVFFFPLKIFVYLGYPIEYIKK